MRHSELVMGRRQTVAFIAAEALDISFERRIKEETPAGGRKPSAPITKAAQKMRLVAVSQLPNFIRQETAGRVFNESWLLVGEYDADVKMDDIFEAWGDRWIVKAVDPRREDMMLAGVARVGDA